MQRESALALLILVLSLVMPVNASPVLGSEYHMRGDTQWIVWLGAGENHRIPSGTLVPHFQFDSLSLEYDKLVSPRKSIGCELSFWEQASGNNNACSILGNYRNDFLVRDRFAAYYAAGIGVICLSDRVNGQATKVNFNERLSVELRYPTDRNSNVFIEYRLCHASNAGIRRPNHGINASVVAIGYSWYL